MVDVEQAMALGAARYGDVLRMLKSEGLPAVFTQTGGMCAAIEVRLEGGMTLLVTDAEDSLAWDRRDHQGWGVGLYAAGNEYDKGPVRFVSSEDGSWAGLRPLIRRILA